MQVRYEVRVRNKDGKLIVKRRFKAFRDAVNFMRDKVVFRRRVSVQRVRVAEQFRIIPGAVWGLSPHDPYQFASAPLDEIFVHTSVTTHLPESATEKAERKEMQNLDAIAKARGFNGISYSYCVFPSGRVYEGRGWLVVEAATEGFNADSDSICFVGNTDAFKPSKAARTSVVNLIDYSQRKKKWAASSKAEPTPRRRASGATRTIVNASPTTLERLTNA